MLKKIMQYCLNCSGTRFLSTEIKITQFPDGFHLKSVEGRLVDKKRLIERGRPLDHLRHRKYTSKELQEKKITEIFSRPLKSANEYYPRSIFLKNLCLKR